VSPSLSAFGPDSPSMGHFPTSPPPPYMPRSLRAGPRESIAGSSITATEATYANVAGDHVADHYAGDAELLTMPWATGFD
jgi:hypothetical protein